MRRPLVCLGVVLFAACMDVPPRAPVEERSISRSSEHAAGGSDVKRRQRPTGKREAAPSDWRPAVYQVKGGDTLYAIALDHGLDYRELAEWNNLNDPSRIRAGQRLSLRAPPGWRPNPVTTKPLLESVKVTGEPLPEVVPVAPAQVSNAPAKPAAAAPTGEAEPVQVVSRVETSFSAASWQWPAQGELLAGYDGARSKGIAIGGKLGDPVLASNAGKVVYVGKAIKTYGQLIIVKHNEEFLTVYAHNSTILVKEGERVNAGQKIATMGEKADQQPALHFEIRRLGQPVDPVKYLAR